MRSFLVLLLLTFGCQDEIKFQTIKKSMDAVNLEEDLKLAGKKYKQCSGDSDCQSGQKCVNKTCTKSALTEPAKLLDSDKHSEYLYINHKDDYWR